MIKFKELFFLFICILTILIGRLSMANEDRDTINMTLKDGVVVIETRPDLAPNHVAQIKQLIAKGQYDGVIFHRVIDGFMAQTGDVEFGNSEKSDFNLSRAGTGGSKMPNIPAEFSNENHTRGTLSMARAQDPNSANSQFFICFQDCSFLDGQYSVWGQVIEGMEFVDNITRGEPPQSPDKIIKMEIVNK